jgi:hypothetical protein
MGHLEGMQLQAIQHLLTGGFLPQATATWSSVLRHMLPDVLRELRQAQQKNQQRAQQQLFQRDNSFFNTGSPPGFPSLDSPTPSTLTAPPGGRSIVKLEVAVVPTLAAERGGAAHNEKVFSFFPYGLFYSFNYAMTPRGGSGGCSGVADGLWLRAGASAAYNLALSYHLHAAEVTAGCPPSAGASSSCASLLRTALNAYKTARDLLESVHDGDPDRKDYSDWPDEQDRLLLLAITNNEGHAREWLLEPLSGVAESLGRLHTILEASGVAYYRRLLSAATSDDRSSMFEFWDLYGSFFLTSGLYPPNEGTPPIHSSAA